MEFRLATMTDLSQIKTVYKKIIQDMYEKHIDIWDEIYPCDYFEEDIRQNKMYVLNDNGIIVAGFVLYDNNPGSKSVQWKYNDGKALYLDRLGVNVDYLRKGIGSMMLKKAEKTAKDLGAHYLRLFVVDINLPAIKLYKKNDYSKASGTYDEVVDDTLTLHEYGYEKSIIKL